MKTLTSLMIFLLGISGMVHSQVYTYEGFDIPLGLEGFTYAADQNTGEGWPVDWHIQGGEDGYIITNSNPLVYPGLQQTQNYLEGGGGYRSAGRELDLSTDGPYAELLNDEGLIGTDGSTLYLSFLARTTNGTFRVGLSSGTDWAWGPKIMSVEHQAGFFRITINEVQYASPIAFETDQTYFVVAKLMFDSTNGNTVDLWVNPTSLGGAEPSADFTATETTATDMAFEDMHWYPGSGGGEGMIDEIRFGATFADVTPPAQEIVWFNFNNTMPQVDGVIDHDTQTITAEVPFAADITNLSPNILLAEGYTSSPASGETVDFTNPVEYTITAPDDSEKVYTVTITQAPADSDNTLLSLNVLQDGKIFDRTDIDQDNETVTINVPSTAGSVFSIQYDISFFATADIDQNQAVDFNDVSEITIIAEDQTEKVYSFVFNTYEPATAFLDDFSMDTYVPNWESVNWNNSGTSDHFQFSWMENTETPEDSYLKITKTSDKNSWIKFTIPDALDLSEVGANVRFKYSSVEQIDEFNVRLVDENAPVPDGNFSHSSGAYEQTIPGSGLYQEIILNFNNQLEDITPYLVKYLVIAPDRTTNTIFSDMRIDHLRMGTDAYANNAPTHDPVSNPPIAEVDDGLQTLVITGITDGNPEREEVITAMVTSSNTEVIPQENVSVTYDAETATATVEYTPVTNGNSTIEVTLTDDRGTVFSDEEDTRTLSFLANFVINEPGVNNPASFGMPSPIHVNVGTPNQHIAVIPDVNDGYIFDEQDIFFEYDNLNPEMITIDSIQYIAGNTYAILYFKDLGVTGTAEVTLSAIDEVAFNEGDDPFVATIPIILSSFDTFGMNYGATEVQHWQAMPYGTDPVFKTGYPIITEAASVPDDPALDFFWGKAWGYIIPPETGTYRFYISADPDTDGPFYLSTDDSPDNLPAEAEPTADKNNPSAFLELEAGKAYYFEGYHKEIINTFDYDIEWIYPGQDSQTLLTEPYVFYFLDQTLPEAPQNLNLLTYGSELAAIEWDEATDNINVAGYQVFVNGNAYNQELTQNTSMILEGLNPETRYDIFVFAVDNSNNYSTPSDPITFTTWQVDETPPTSPDGLTLDETTSFSISLSWNEATDGETTVIGYNVYTDGNTTPVNEELIIGTSYKITSLDLQTEYSITVHAVDAALNESAPSSPLVASTNVFEWDNPNEETYVGLASFELESITPSTGFGVEVDYGLKSIMLSNKVGFGSYEDSRFVDNVSADVLEQMNIQKSEGMIFNSETDDPYEGTKAAELQGTADDWIRNGANFTMNPAYNYKLQFAAKRAENYADAEVQIRVFRDVGGTVVAFEDSFTPTENWEMYEFEFPGIADAFTSWKIEFRLTQLGTIFLDDVELHTIEWMLPDSKFTSVGLEILEEIKPAGLRWGAIGANSKNLYESAAAYQKRGLTFGDVAYLSSLYGDYALLCLGVNSATDYMTNYETFGHFVEYINGEAGSSTWSDIRVAEGYEQPFTEILDGIVIEMGNEVWGFDAHDADTFEEDYAVYSSWAADITENQIKASAAYNPDKMWVSFSGRSPDLNYGLHNDLFSNENGQMDMLGISGYLGGNLDYDPAIPVGESQLDYHKNSYFQMLGKLNGLESVFREMLLRGMNRVVPQYMYEGNLTRSEYNGTAGQAVTFADYYSTAAKNGVTLPSIFALEGGQWRLIDNQVTLNKRPLYYHMKYYNNMCKGGDIMPTNLQTIRSIYNDNDSEINLDPVGIHAFHNEGKYSMALFSRDFENDYVLQLDLPDGTGTPTNGQMVVITSESFNSTTVSIEETTIDIQDEMLITVPKYGAVYLSFEADAQELAEQSLGSFGMVQAADLLVTTENDKVVIDGIDDEIVVDVAITPEDVFYDRWDWEFVENSAGLIFTRTNGRLYPISSSENGTAKLRFWTLDGSNIVKELDVEAINLNLNTEELVNAGIGVFPNPAQNELNLSLSDQYGHQGARYEIFSVHGNVVAQGTMTALSETIDITDMESGVYFVRILVNEKILTTRFIKQ